MKIYDTPSDNSNSIEVDFEALNNYVVQTCRLERPQTMIGVISNVVDLGIQPQNNSNYDVDKGDENLSLEELREKYADKIADPKDFLVGFDLAWDDKVKDKVIKKVVSNKPQQSVAIAVDFPSIMLNKGQFFGEENAEERPLRLWMGGKYWDKENKKFFIQNVTPLKVTKDEKLGWTVPPRSQLYKMAEGAELMSFGTAFDRANTDKLLGKSLQFKVQVYFHESKGKKYYTEKISYVGALSRDQEPKYLDNTYLIEMDNPANSEVGIKELPAHVVNTLKLAENFNESVLKTQLERIRGGSGTNTTTDTEKPKQEQPSEPKPATSPKTTQVDGLDDDLPF